MLFSFHTFFFFFFRRSFRQANFLFGFWSFFLACKLSFWILGILFHKKTDENKGATSRDPLHVPVGPITRARAKRFKEALNGLIQDTWASSELLKSKMSPHEST